MPFDDREREAEKNVTLKRTAYADGVALPSIMGWQWNLSHSMLDPTDITRERYLEEVADELGTPPAGKE
jgi:hypothetical protein